MREETRVCRLVGHALCAALALTVVHHPALASAQPAPEPGIAATQPASGQTTITLRPRAEKLATDEAAAQITLAEIADLTGPESTSLGGLIIARPKWTASDRSVGVPLSRVRDVLSAAGVHWGRVTLTGSTCRVSLAGSNSPRPVTTPGPNARPITTSEPAQASAAGTLRRAVTDRLCALFGVAQMDLRAAFDDRDAAMLDEAVAGRRVDVIPGATGQSPRLPVSVQVYDSDRLVLDRSLIVQIEVRRPVVLAKSAVARGQVIGEADVESVSRWGPPTSRPSLSIDKVVGMVASARLVPGQVVTLEQAQGPVIVRRGEMVTVHVLSGSVTVRTRARAMSSARDGELVTLKVEGSDRTFQARMNGPGRAVVMLSPTSDAPAPSADTLDMSAVHQTPDSLAQERAP